MCSRCGHGTDDHTHHNTLAACRRGGCGCLWFVRAVIAPQPRLAT